MWGKLTLNKINNLDWMQINDLTKNFQITYPMNFSGIGCFDY